MSAADGADQAAASIRRSLRASQVSPGKGLVLSSQSPFVRRSCKREAGSVPALAVKGVPLYVLTHYQLLAAATRSS